MECRFDIHLSAHCSACHDFNDGARRETKTIWLYPDEILTEGNMLVVSWKCSAGKFCLTKCNYATGVN